MKTKYPFELPLRFRDLLPKSRNSGFYYIDVKVRNKWDGILVVNEQFQCVGIRCDRRTMEWPLPFTPEEIEDIRCACLWNRLMACIPSSLVLGIPYICLILLPLFIWLSKLGGISVLFIGISVGIVGQVLIMRNLKAYCLTSLFLITSIFALQVVALLRIFRK